MNLTLLGLHRSSPLTSKIVGIRHLSKITKPAGLGQSRRERVKYCLKYQGLRSIALRIDDISVHVCPHLIFYSCMPNIRKCSFEIP